MVFSHVFAGAALTHVAIKPLRKKFSTKDINILYIVGICASILPDLDILLLLFDNATMHRSLLTHSFILYLLITLVVWIYSQIRSDRLLATLSWVFLLGVFSHLILDALVGGVVLFGPITNKVIGYPLHFPTAAAQWAIAYLTSKYMLWEIIIFMVYLYVIKGAKRKVLLGLPFFFLMVATVMFIVVFFGILN